MFLFLFSGKTSILWNFQKNKSAKKLFQKIKNFSKKINLQKKIKKLFRKIDFLLRIVYERI
jgi:hypothetical protein